MESSSWLSAKISKLHAAQPDRTVALVVTKKEIKEVYPTVELISTLAKSKEFRQDLNMAGAYWFYHPQTSKRCLLV